MTIDISDNDPRISYTVASGVTQTSFVVPFEFFDDSDVNVYVNNVLKTITTDYTISGGDGSTGTVTISVTGPATVTLTREITIERVTDFPTGIDINRAALNTQLDTLTAIAADIKDSASRSLRIQDSDTTVSLEIPLASERANKIFSFDSIGALNVTNEIGVYRGDWAASVDYNQRDLVKDTSNSNIYLCVVSHTSTGSQPISSNADSAKWELIVDAAAAGASATAAAASEAAAAVSETNAANSETAAAASEAAAAASESAAAASEANSASSAAASAASALAAAASETAAGTSETNSAASEAAAAASASAASTSSSNAATSEANSASSASTASTAAATATTQAAAASASATAAAASESAAATSASSASSSATAAQSSADAALAALDSFDDRYLGQKASDPTLDNDGNALVAGALYFNTTDDVMKVYEGSAWVAAYASLSGALIANNNLSDLQSVATARTNLGLGTAATTASTDYATAAQGALADSAVQPNDSPTFAGLTTTADVSFGDNDKAIFGAGSDLQIYHDGSHSYIDDAGTGDLRIRADNLLLKSVSGEDYITATANGSVSIAYDNATKLATTSTGVTVTGTVSATSFAGDGSALTGLPSSAPSTAQVLSATAGASAGPVGTYAFLGSSGGNAEYIFGNNYSGSSLRAGCVDGSSNPSSAGIRIDGPTQSGTWKSMGNRSGPYTIPITLFLRIS